MPTPHPMNSSQKNTATRQDMGYMQCKKTKNLVHGFAHKASVPLGQIPWCIGFSCPSVKQE